MTNEAKVEFTKAVIDSHSHQTRMGGAVALPQSFHPIEVTTRLWRWGAIDTPVMFMAAMGHDLFEDTLVVPGDIEKFVVDLCEFGNPQQIAKQVSDLIQELTFEGDDKTQYLESFATKSIEALVIKVGDRFSNVWDFLFSSPNYAVKYYRKADPIWRIVTERRQDIINRFGEKVSWNLDEDHTRLRQQLVPYGLLERDPASIAKRA